MDSVYRAIVRRPAATLLVVALLTAFFGWHARNMRLDASVQTLLNEGDDQKAYYDEIRALFGSDEIGVVGVLADDVYEPAVLKKIQDLTARISKVDGVQEVVSLTNAADPVEDVIQPPPLIPRRGCRSCPAPRGPACRSAPRLLPPPNRARGPVRHSTR